MKPADIFRIVPRTAAFLALLLGAGCATQPMGEPLPTVGPMPGAYGPFGGRPGYLQVYSATRACNDGGIVYYPHTSYSVYHSDGKKAAGCLNHAGADDQVPFVLPLEPGNYAVYAEAGGLGLVKVPVVIQRNRITLVFLERGGMPSKTEALMLGAPVVRAPDGRIIGAAPRSE